VRAGIATDHAFSSDVVTSASTWLDHWALDRIRGSVPLAPIRFVLWDGFERQPVTGPAVATIVFKNRQALLSWVWDAQLNFGETYMFGAVEVRGDLVALLEAVYNALPVSSSRRWRRAPAANDERAASENVHSHYDLGNDFYRLWLDHQLLYTCAYFPNPACSLEEAQVAKMDLVCRKLALRPGERVVEAGCGWGALALHMARHYGVTVKAFNLSVEQIAHARTRAREEGLDGRVEFVLDDYRNVRGAFDVFVSVGMLEHVGLADYETFGRVIDGAITANGRGLLHFIGRNQALPLNPWIRKRIFPGAYPPTLREVFGRVIEPTGLSVLDVENLRLHYALTLRHWRRRFLDAVDEVRTMFDDSFARAWDLYLAGSQAAFTTGSMQLFQVVFARGSTNAIPWTRRDGHV
jgi:cyclopropane-fatty-acyl-phospholipid synthase